ncbi:MAG TPA: helix-turn-helix domain-containing protein [Chitinophagaceae bacterium]|jgi:AraC-like DNA-binding protein|nr:helix-turn-helix domain-containing protein [Chitinophagaceae bacterium]
MLFDFNRYTSLLFVFFVHGLVYAAVLLGRSLREERTPDRWLALFLFLCCLYITPWMVGFAGWYDTQPYRDLLFYVPFQHLLLLGPVMFFYVQSLLNPSFALKRRDALHFLPAAGYLVFSGVVYVTDKLVLRRYYFLAEGQDPDFDSWYQALGFLSMTVYSALSLRYFRLFRGLMLQVTSYADRLRFSWVQHFILAFLVMLGLRLLFFIGSFFWESDYSNGWWYYLLFGIIFYYMALSGHANAVRTKLPFEAELLENKASLTADGETNVHPDRLEAGPAVPEAGSDPQAGFWKERIGQLMDSERPYENPELTLPDLARRLGCPPSQLSRVINTAYGCNFNDFINAYRVSAVKERFSAGVHQQQTLLAIAFDSGFNSKATFNRAFLKATGQSPSDYLRATGQNAVDNQHVG